MYGTLVNSIYKILNMYFYTLQCVVLTELYEMYSVQVHCTRSPFKASNILFRESARERPEMFNLLICFNRCVRMVLKTAAGVLSQRDCFVKTIVRQRNQMMMIIKIHKWRLTVCRRKYY